MPNTYKIQNARRAAGDPTQCLIVLHDKDGEHIEVRVSLTQLNEMVDALNKGAETD